MSCAHRAGVATRRAMLGCPPDRLHLVVRQAVVGRADSEPDAVPAGNRQLSYAGAMTALAAGTVTFVASVSLALGIQLAPGAQPAAPKHTVHAPTPQFAEAVAPAVAPPRETEQAAPHSKAPVGEHDDTYFGEFLHFKAEDRTRLVYMAVKRSRVPIVVGVSHSTLDGAVELGREAISAGAAACSTVTIVTSPVHPPGRYTTPRSIASFCKAGVSTQRFGAPLAKGTPSMIAAYA